MNWVVKGQAQTGFSLTGIEFVNDNPLTAEPYIYATTGNQLLRISQSNGSVYVLGPTTSPLPGDPIPGANIQGLAWNPLIYNPFTGAYGALIATDATADQLVIIDDRPRFPGPDIFAIYVAQASENASICISRVPDFDPANPTAPRYFDPYSGDAGQLRVYSAQGGAWILVSASGSGTVYLGERTLDIDPKDPIDDKWPIIAGNIGQIGVRPAGFDDWPTDGANNLSAGLVVSQNLLTFIDGLPGLVNHEMGMNVSKVTAMAISHDGNIFAVDADQFDQTGMPINQDQIVQIDPVTGKALSAAGLFSGMTPLHGVQALAYGDVNGDGQQDLYAVVSMTSYVPDQLVRQPLVGDVFNESAQALTVTPGGVLYAIAADPSGNFDLFQINRPADGSINVSAPMQVFEVLPNGTPSPVTDIQSIEASTLDGTLYIIGKDDQNHQTLYTVNPHPVSLLAGNGKQVQATRIAELTLNGLAVTDSFTALAFQKQGNVNEQLYGVRRTAGGSSLLYTVDTSNGTISPVIGATLGSNEIRVAGSSHPTLIQGMDFDADGNLIAVDRGPDAGTGRLISINIDPVSPDPGMSQVISLPDSIAADHVGYTCDLGNLFYTIDMAGPNHDDQILVTPGAVPMLGTITLTYNQAQQSLRQLQPHRLGWQWRHSRRHGHGLFAP